MGGFRGQMGIYYLMLRNMSGLDEAAPTMEKEKEPGPV